MTENERKAAEQDVATIDAPVRQEVVGWHFAAATLRDGRALHKAGETLLHEGEVVACESGLHASERAIDALQFAPGAMVARVRLSGIVVSHGTPVDKHAASERTNLTDYVDATRVLHEFACWCATQALDSEDAAGRAVDPRSRAAIATKLLWLDGKASDKDLAAARAAARDAERAVEWAAARDAARAAERAAAWAAARAAAWAAAWAAARAAAWAAQNVELERRLSELFGRVRP